MKIDQETLHHLLVLPGHITASQLDAVLEKSSVTEKSPLQILVAEGYISDSNLGRTIADGFGYRFVDLEQEKIARETLELIPESVARNQQVIAYQTNDTTISIATTNPDNHIFFPLVGKKTGKRVDVAYTTFAGIQKALHSYKKDLRDQAQKLIHVLELDPKNESGIIELVNLILEYSYDSEASDIHIEPLE